MSGQTDPKVIVGGDRPTKKITQTLDGVRVVQTVEAAILNFDDPDVRVFHSHLNSIGPDYDEICARGRIKARYSWRGITQSLVPSAKSWARLLGGFPGTELTIEQEQDLPGDAGEWEGWAHPAEGVSVSFGQDGVRVLVQDNGKGEPLSVATEIRGKSMERFDLKSFLRDARLRLRKARKRLDEIGSLGVTFGGED
jgi:hypothetical protein